MRAVPPRARCVFSFLTTSILLGDYVIITLIRPLSWLKSSDILLRLFFKERKIGEESEDSAALAPSFSSTLNI